MQMAQYTSAVTCAPAWRAPLIVGVLGLVWYFWLPEQLGLLTKLALISLLVLSLDLIVGYAGLATLGHAAIFGVGAYAAGIFALRIHSDPLLGLLIGMLAGGSVAFLTGLFLLRYQGFTFLMLTVAVAQIIQNLANKFRNLTGGDDGLSGFTMAPLLGRYSFDLEGKTAALYALATLLVFYYLAGRLVDSPFGLAVRGIHENRDRMSALGTPVYRRLILIYIFSGVLGGASGALSAQTNAIVGLDSLSFSFSAEILVMLILGGAGRLHGALVGSIIFALLHHTAASIDPYHWLFVIGIALMIVVLIPPKKLIQRAKPLFYGWIRQ
jgi:branched-chain amino acid transport system permease protein